MFVLTAAYVLIRSFPPIHGHIQRNRLSFAFKIRFLFFYFFFRIKHAPIHAMKMIVSDDAIQEFALFFFFFRLNLFAFYRAREKFLQTHNRKLNFTYFCHIDCK